MDVEIQSIIDLIRLYTERIEDLDHLTIDYVMTTFGCISVLIGIISSSLVLARRKNSKGLVMEGRIYKTSAIMFLLISLILCVFTGVLTLNFRKVAVYRVYLQVLESEYNALIMSKSSIGELNKIGMEYIGKYSMIKNTNGLLTNSIVSLDGSIVVILGEIFSFIMSLHFWKRGMDKNTKRKSNLYSIVFKIAFILLLFVCTTIIVSSIFDLVINNVNAVDLSKRLKT